MAVIKGFDEIYIERSVLKTELAERIMASVPEDRIRIVSGKEEAAGHGALIRPDAPAFKRRLFITREKGRFLRRCPGSPGMACCNLFVLNPIVGCPYDCTYCFLQAYQNEPFITLYANLEDLEHEVRALHALNKGKLLRICTGELADSLALAPLADAAAYLIGRLCRNPGVLLELKTKSTRIEHLLKLDHRERAVISWSLNPGPVAALEERGTPGPRARLNAAAAVADAGYPTAFHFDPIIRYEGWKADYTCLLDDLFRSVPPSGIRWISLGGFRYTPEMKALILDRFPETRLFLDEFLPCPDGKYRYYSGHRIELYRTMVERIRRFSDDVPVYLCMESEFIWRKVFGTLPGDTPELEPLFGPRDG